MGEACNTYEGRREVWMGGCGGETWEKETELEDSDVDERIIISWTSSSGMGDHKMDWSGPG